MSYLSTRTPLKVPGAAFWLRADLGFNPITKIWNDQSENRAVFTGAGAPVIAANAIADKPGVLIQAVDGTTFSAPHIAAYNFAAYTIYAVLKPTVAIAAFAALLMKVHDAAWASGWGLVNADGAGGSFQPWSGVYTNFATTGAQGVNVPGIIRGEFDGANVSGFLNNVAGSVHAAAQVDNADSLVIGGAPGGSIPNATLAEIVGWGRVLTAAEKAYLKTYFQNRYGISG